MLPAPSQCFLAVSMVSTASYGSGHAEPVLSRDWCRRLGIGCCGCSSHCARRLRHLAYALHRLLHGYRPGGCALLGIPGQAEPMQTCLLAYLLPPEASQRGHAQREGEARECVQHVAVQPVHQLVAQVARDAAVGPVPRGLVGRVRCGECGTEVRVGFLAHVHQEIRHGSGDTTHGDTNRAELRRFVDEASGAGNVGVLPEGAAAIESV
mmetsp:Transcript_25429/g.42602  ORF Transcript_25429/g.42602 Transcript_25429/m.42602 type:complete len:209 (-) Transcript_25429:1130-1756(-)